MPPTRRARLARPIPLADSDDDRFGDSSCGFVALRHRRRGRLSGAARVLRRRRQPWIARMDRRNRTRCRRCNRAARFAPLLRRRQRPRRARAPPTELVEGRTDGRDRRRLGMHSRPGDGGCRRLGVRRTRRRSRRRVRGFDCAGRRNVGTLRRLGRVRVLRDRALAVLASRTLRCRDRVGDRANLLAPNERAPVAPLRTADRVSAPLRRLPPRRASSALQCSDLRSITLQALRGNLCFTCWLRRAA